MIILFWGNLFFFGLFLLHLAAWKVRIPRRQTKVLLLMFFGGLALSVVGLTLNPDIKLMGVRAPAGAAELLAFTLYASAFILAYMITYSAIEADSPTLVMIKAVADAGDNGLGKEAFAAAMSDEVLTDPRLRDLLTDKMAVVKDGRYVLTSKGRLFAAIFVNYRALLGLGKGG